MALPAIAEDSDNYLSVTGPCNLEFPEDHGAHPDYRTEWWYYTGNLRSEKGDPYGFQLTFFRSRISTPGDDKKWPSKPSAWRVSQVYLAHAAVADMAAQQHLQAEDVARAALGMAGVIQSAQHTKIFLKNWSIQIEAHRQRLKVKAADFSYELSFKPAKPLVLHGDRGYNLKGATPDRACCYYSFTRLEGHGSMTIGDNTVAVTGSAWMDHEFSTAPLEPGITGWDWFSLQLSDYSEVMVYLFRTEKGGLHAASSGTCINADGIAHQMTSEDIAVDVLDTWQSKQSKARYPSKWRMQIKTLAFDVRITSNLPDQEMRTLNSTGATYWEGSVSIEGTKNKHPVKGEGYVELTGYAEDFDAPI
ncbi:MAG: carotenoid 1,2-hydratase [bacterium]|nr:carotenoid 1,2-hydratase [bacterium]